MATAPVTTVPGSVQTLPANDPIAALLHPQAATLEVGDRRGRGRDSALISAYTQAVANGASPDQAVSTLLGRFQPAERMKAATVLARHMATLARDPAKAAEVQGMRSAITTALSAPADPQPAAPVRSTRQPARTDNRPQPRPDQQNPEAQQPQQAGGIFGAIGNFFKGIFDFFARLFGGGNRQPQQTEGQQPVPRNLPQPQ